MARIEAEKDLDTALRWARWLALYLWENHLGLYRLDEIEKLIIDKCLPILTPPASSGLVDAELHVASAIYKNGGHTALMRSLMRNAKRTVHALITRSDDPVGDTSLLDLQADCVSHPPQAANAQQKIEHLVDVMTRYERIILHIHPDDVMCAVALFMLKQIKPSVQIIFVNHADHVFSVGWLSVDLVMEISIYGWALRPQRQVEHISSFIGIPIPCPPPLERQRIAQPPFAMSGGASFKFKPSNGMSLPHVLAQLLKEAPDLHMKVVGASSKDWWWWPLKIKYRKRIHLVKSLPKADYKKMLDECAIYIDSYPWLGGTAFPEALMLGVPVAGMTGLAWGYSSADQIRSSNAHNFVQTCLKLLHKDADSTRQQEQARLRCIAFHAEKAVRDRMDACLDSNILVAPDNDLLDINRHHVTPQNPQSRSVLPSRKRGGLLREDIQAMASIHRHAFGLLNWSSVTLLYYAATGRSSS